ncbi:MAG: hypothetical protein HYX47_01925 [Burkholderiales bacterium]|nr:hypothetical protein [Burkholderiales bacterium]
MASIQSRNPLIFLDPARRNPAMSYAGVRTAPIRRKLAPGVRLSFERLIKDKLLLQRMNFRIFFLPMRVRIAQDG